MPRTNPQNFKFIDLIKNIVVPPLSNNLSSLVVILFSLILLSLSQGTFLLLIGPVLKAVFSLGTANDYLNYRDFFPSSLTNFFPLLNKGFIHKQNLIFALPIILVISALLRSLSTYFFQSRSAFLSLVVANEYREKLFSHIIKQPFSKIAKNSPAYWMSTIMNDTLYLQTKFSDIANGIIKNIFLIFSAFIVIAILHIQTAVILILTCPFIAFTTGAVQKKISFFASLFQRKLAKMAEVTLEIRSRFEFIKVHKGESFEKKRFQDFNQGYYDFIKRSFLIRSFFAPSLDFLGIISISIIIIIFSDDITSQSGGNSINIMIFLAAFGALIRPLKEIGEQITNLGETKGALTKSLFLLQELKKETLEDKTVPLERKEPSIYISNLDIGYSKKILTLKDVNIEPGNIIGIFGESGCGKTTLIRTLAGLIPPLNISGSSQYFKSWVKHTTLVGQKPFLFKGTVLENLNYGLKHTLNSFEIEKALSLAYIKNDVENFPQHLNTPIDAILSNISGGQKQRLALSRALLKNKLFFIFDEITSDLDQQAEKIVIDRLCSWARKEQKCIIMTTHKQEYMNKFDSLWFVRNGRVEVERNYGKT